MSPQFVDFDADGKLDIVAGIFDGSPHLVRGSEKGWGAPEQILDRDGARIVLNHFWNLDTKKWDKTDRHDAPGHKSEGHFTSAVAFDWDGDGDHDLLLGDHRSGAVYRRMNEGTAQKPAFTTVNEPVLAAGQPIDVPGTVATLRLVDWNGDGLLDLGCGAMGLSYGNGEGGAVYMFLNTGTKTAPVFAAPLTLIEPSKAAAAEPTRPDSGLYMDFGDHDGDGDLDIVVGGYSHWTPKGRELSAEEQARVTTLKADLAAIDEAVKKVMKEIEDAIKGLDKAAADEVYKEKSPQLNEINKRRRPLQTELEPLVPSAKRVSYVWLYENTSRGAKAASSTR